MTRLAMVGTVSEFLARLAQAKAILHGNTESPVFFYRGQTEDWPLVPSLYRVKPKQAKLDHVTLEKKLLKAFRLNGPAYPGHIPLSNNHMVHWAQLRHCGLPTRLLDWSKSPLFALYFAVREPGTSPSVWVLNATRMNDFVRVGENVKTRNHYPSNFVKPNAERPAFPVALQSELAVGRLIAQQGRFTAHGTDKRPLEKLRPESLRRIRVKPSKAKGILKELINLGISEVTIFPDLDALARDLSRRYTTQGLAPPPA